MEVNAIIQEIERLPLSKRFLVMEQTLQSIKKEELAQHIAWDNDNADSMHLVSETSLAKEWLSQEDNRWDAVL
ncbi:MAG: hypothetical protein LBE82_08185 [Chitinophagaceae bacterium]|jgi:hypothetical protein|nr:hypothetical protein [Chitinophagaceae bacterium]